MTNKEFMEMSEIQLQIFSGILFHNQRFSAGKQESIQYTLDCPEFERLREDYDLLKIAGRGGDFARAKRLLHYLAPRLKHSSWYDNHVPCNARDLLEYSLNKPENGINCLNKSKILEECCLAVGIYARRVSIMPYSPYDFDSHVVTEIYARELKKWVMLDPTTDGYFVDEDGKPLSLLEMRKRFANGRFVTFVRAGDRLKDLPRLRKKYVDRSSYICKNLFYFRIGNRSGFGEPEFMLTFCPAGFSVRENMIQNARFRIGNMPEENIRFVAAAKEKLRKLESSAELAYTDVSVMYAAPEGMV